MLNRKEFTLENQPYFGVFLSSYLIKKLELLTQNNLKCNNMKYEAHHSCKLNNLSLFCLIIPKRVHLAQEIYLTSSIKEKLLIIYAHLCWR